MGALVIEERVVISGPGLTSPVIVPKGDVKKEGDAMYIHVTGKPWWANRVFGSSASKTERILSRTDVIEQLTSLRQEKLNAIVAEKQPAEQLPIFEGYKKQKVIVGKVDVPATVTINTPSIGGVGSIAMTCLMSHKCNAPLFVELNVANVTYMRSACVWQIEHMGLKRGRAPKKNENLDDGSDESKNEVESVESKESDEDMMCECDDNVSKEGDDEAMASVVDDPVELDSHGAFATHDADEPNTEDVPAGGVAHDVPASKAATPHRSDKITSYFNKRR